TTSYEVLNEKEGLAERLVRAMIETIHFTRVHPDQAQRFLDEKDTRPYSQQGGHIEAITRSPIKPYPSPEGVLNAWELSRMRYEDAEAANPLALWDMHYRSEERRVGKECRSRWAPVQVEKSKDGVGEN